MGWKCCRRKQQAFNGAAPRGLRNVERQNPRLPPPPTPPLFLERCINVRTLERLGLRCCLAFSATVVQTGTVLLLSWSFTDLLSSVWEVYSHCFYTLVRLRFYFKWAEITSWHGYFYTGASRCLHWTNEQLSTSDVPQGLRWDLHPRLCLFQSQTWRSCHSVKKYETMHNICEVHAINSWQLFV